MVFTDVYKRQHYYYGKELYYHKRYKEAAGVFLTYLERSDGWQDVYKRQGVPFMPETNETYQPMTFDAIRIGLASSEKILEWSHGCLLYTSPEAYHLFLSLRRPVFRLRLQVQLRPDR